MNQHPPVRTPSQGALRRGERATWGTRPAEAPTCPAGGAKLISWRPYRNPAGTMLGFVSAQLQSGLIINDLKIMRGPKGALWVAAPAVKVLDADGNPRLDARGKPTWRDFIEFRDKVIREKFSSLIVALVRGAHPGDLEDGGAS
ncbi:MAG: hypothetical protein ACJ8AH_19960 [Stellaceae bacterium]